MRKELIHSKVNQTNMYSNDWHLFQKHKKKTWRIFWMAFDCAVHRNNQVKCLKNESAFETTTERIKRYATNQVHCYSLNYHQTVWIRVLFVLVQRSGDRVWALSKRNKSFGKEKGSNECITAIIENDETCTEEIDGRQKKGSNYFVPCITLIQTVSFRSIWCTIKYCFVRFFCLLLLLLLFCFAK